MSTPRGVISFYIEVDSMRFGPELLQLATAAGVVYLIYRQRRDIHNLEEQFSTCFELFEDNIDHLPSNRKHTQETSIRMNGKDVLDMYGCNKHSEGQGHHIASDLHQTF